MTVKDTAAVMDILSAAYPQFYSRQSNPERMAALKTWAAVFSKDDPQDVVEALREFISTDASGFPPTPGQIRSKLPGGASRREHKFDDFDEACIAFVRCCNYHLSGIESSVPDELEEAAWQEYDPGGKRGALFGRGHSQPEYRRIYLRLLEERRRARELPPHGARQSLLPASHNE